MELTIGGRIKEWREKRAMTVWELARKAKLAMSTIYDLERGASKSTTRLHLIAAALGINVHWLETGRGDPENLGKQPTLESAPWPFTFDPSRWERLDAGTREVIQAMALAVVKTKERATLPAREKKHSEKSSG